MREGAHSGRRFAVVSRPRWQQLAAGAESLLVLEWPNGAWASGQ